MSKYGIALATAGLSLIMASEVSAAVVTYSFDGVLTGGGYSRGDCKDCGAPPLMEIGSKISGSISFDDALLTTNMLDPGVVQGGAFSNNIASYVFNAPRLTYSEQGVSLYTELTNKSLAGPLKPDVQDLFSMVAGRRLSFAYGGANTDYPAPLFAGDSVSFAQTLNAGSNGRGSYQAMSGDRYDFSITNASFVAPLPAVAEPSTVPEPGTYSLFLAAVGVMAWATRRRPSPGAPVLATFPNRSAG